MQFLVKDNISGNEMLINAENPKRALIIFINHCFIYDLKSDNWNYDVEITKANKSKISKLD